MSSSPIRPSLTSMLSKKKRSPAGAIDLPSELPTFELTSENIPKASSPTAISAKIETAVKIKTEGKSLNAVLLAKGFTIIEGESKYLTSKEQDSTIAYYVKAFDKFGTPVYICLGSLTDNIALDPNSVNPDMIRVRENNVDSSELNYVISSNKSDTMIECVDGSFCVVNYNNDGTVTVDRFHIPSASKLNIIKEEVLGYQTESNNKLSSPVAPINYTIVQYSDIINGISPARYKEFYDTFNKSITDLKAASDNRFNDFATKIGNLKIVIDQTMNNRKIGFDRIQTLKKAMKIDFNQNQVSSDITHKLYKYNTALEKYIILSNMITKLQYEAKTIYDGIVSCGNKFFDTYDDATK
jgi:hypothetical protein